MNRILAVALVAFPFAAYGKTTSDRDFVQKAGSAGMYEVQAAQMALSKSKNDQVKSIAEHLIEDHQQVNDQLKSIAKTEGMTVPSQLLPEHQAQIDKLQSFSPGKDFDQAYLAQQRKGHEDAIQLFQNEASAGQDPALKSFAEQTVPTLRMHYQMVQRGAHKM